MLGRQLMSDAYEDSDLVFAREDGAIINPDAFSDMFWRHVKGAKPPLIRFHDVRHTHASLALAAGVHPKVVSERLGHSTVSITLDTYSHAIPALEEDAAARIAAILAADAATGCTFLVLPRGHRRARPLARVH